MKKILISALALCFACQSYAQQATKTKHMVISIYFRNTIHIGKSPNNMFITRDDTAQVQKHINFSPSIVSYNDVAKNEAILMDAIKPYYVQGWKLVSTSADSFTTTDAAAETLRYYFTKD